MVVASLLYAVCLYRAYGALDTLSPYIYYELLIIKINEHHDLGNLKLAMYCNLWQLCNYNIMEIP